MKGYNILDLVTVDESFNYIMSQKHRQVQYSYSKNTSLPCASLIEKTSASPPTSMEPYIQICLKQVIHIVKCMSNVNVHNLL